MACGKAIKMAYKNFDEYNEKLKSLREYYISNVEKRIKDIRLPGNSNISFKDVDGSCLLLKLDEVRNLCIKWFCL